MRINKYLAECGVASRRASDKLNYAGQRFGNGCRTERAARCKIRLLHDEQTERLRLYGERR